MKWVTMVTNTEETRYAHIIILKVRAQKYISCIYMYSGALLFHNKNNKCVTMEYSREVTNYMDSNITSNDSK